MSMSLDQLNKLARSVDVEYFNPTFDPTITVAVVRDRETGAVWTSESRPDDPEMFSAAYGKQRALMTALYRAVTTKPEAK